MLQDYTLLAHSGDKRSVQLRNDGAVHLVWDEVTVRLFPFEFRQIERLLEVGVVELDLTAIRDGCFCLKQPHLGKYLLSLGQLELGLSLQDFLELAKITYTAAQQLDRGLDQPIRQREEMLTSHSGNDRATAHQQIWH